jgi:hypothetical protein
MDVRVDATMRWDGVVAVKRSRARRWVTVLGVVVPVTVVTAFGAWFVRSHIIPPNIVIPSPMALASAPPTILLPAAETDGRAAAAEPQSPPTAMRTAASAAVEPPAGGSTAGETIPSGAAVDIAGTTPSPPLPMFQSLALAPPAAPFGPPPFAHADPGRAPPAAEPVEAGVPIAGPVPLPPRRPRAAVARAPGPVPLPPIRPPQ